MAFTSFEGTNIERSLSHAFSRVYLEPMTEESATDVRFFDFYEIDSSPIRSTMLLSTCGRPELLPDLNPKIQRCQRHLLLQD